MRISELDVTFTVDIHHHLVPDFIGQPPNMMASRSARCCAARYVVAGQRAVVHGPHGL
jgi:hypothetical protein